METVRRFALWLLVALGLARKPDFIASMVREHPAPDAMKPGHIYVLTSQGHAKWAYFLCPDDSTEVIQLSLMPSRRPNWRLTRDWLGRPSIYPSVWQTAGSYAHFWIRGGTVEWCPDSGKPVQNGPDGNRVCV